ncbi:MAG: S41 family peptidase [Oscillospiraceae bacterium]|nr:S41 family peptidase [Oscillospiraceae bacterium]MCI7489147.1 S41 family peptidase [Oscillospiraceae bacterium]MDY5071305.1 S41 family peptidase [Oscillospiraceae bacterium]
MKTKSKNKKLRIALGICIPLIIIIAAALAVVMKYGPTFGFYLVPPSAETYGKNALSTIDKNGIFAGNDEWKSTYNECLKMIENAKSYDDTYDAIRKALSVGGGKHSMLMTKSESQDTTESYDEVLPTVSLDGDIAIIKLPDFLGTAEAGQKYAKVAEDFIHENRDKIKGVVLDLRGNTGGDMGPMATAVSSLLPDGELVYYHYRSYDVPVTLKNGVVSNAGTGGKSLYPEEKLNVPVAILTDDMTASSGEALTLCFRGLENTRTFGAPTAGYTSVNMLYNMYDGAQMYLTVAFDKARTGEIFKETPIEPDVATDSPLEAALEWLRG